MMSFWKRFSGKGDPRGSDAAEQEYVRRCLEQQFREEREDRRWDSPGIVEVNSLLRSGKYKECAQAAEAKAAENSDLDLYYNWGGLSYLRMKEYGLARRILLKGVATAKRKSRTCDVLGQVEWEDRHAKEAIYWWVQAVHCLESIKDDTAWNPYLHLHYVADGLGLADVAAAFIARADRIRVGGTRLTSTSAADLRDLARQQTTPGMRTVLIAARDRYLQPSSPAKEDLSKEEQDLDLLLHRIESGLKNRPNPAFSMVSLGLHATALGRKVVWCYRASYDQPGTMDQIAAANFLNQELRAIGVTVSAAGSMGGSGGEGNQLFDYDFGTAAAQPAADAREIGRFIKHTDYVDSAVFLFDGTRAVSSGREGSLRAWGLATLAELRAISDRDLLNGVLAVKPGTNHVLLVYGKYLTSNVVRQWDVDSGELSDVCRLNTEIIDGLHSAVFSADCRTMIGQGFKRIGLWNLNGSELITHFEVVNPVRGSYCQTALSADGQYILCAEGDNVIHLVNATSGQRTIKLMGHEDRVTGVRFAPSGDLAVSSSDDQTVRIWDLHSGREIRCLRGHSSGVWCLDLSGDGKYVASGGSGFPRDQKDCTVRVWDMDTGSELARYAGHDDAVRSVRFNPDGELLMSASVDKTVRLWNVR